MKTRAHWLFLVACALAPGRARADEAPTEVPTPDPSVSDSTSPSGPTFAEVPALPPVEQATDSERVPMSPPPSRERRARPLATASEGLASPVPPPPDPLAGRRYPETAAHRPLTLAEGVWRLDHVVDWNVMHFAFEAPNTLTAGITNEVELGVGWPWTRDPTFFGAVRFLATDVIDLGVRAAVRVPAVTTGDTVVRAGIPVVLRPTRHVRIQTGVDVELLLTPQVSPWAWIPLQILGNPVPSMFLGAQGSLGLIDGQRWTGQAGLFVGHTVSATPTGHPIFEIRWTTSYMFELNDLHITVAASFFPRFW
jgi:hypothetical protein